MTITINDFFKMLIKTPELPGVFHVYFLYQDRASTFYEQLFNFCKRYIVDIALMDDIEMQENIPRLLSTSFLGQRYFYWSFNTELPSKVNTFLENYQGPNCLFRIIANDQPKGYKHQSGKLIVEIPTYVDRNIYHTLYNYFYKNSVKESGQLFEQNIFNYSYKYSFDQAILLMRYQALLEKESILIQKQFFKSWYSLNIESYNYMFKLSDLLFALDYRQFFLKWQEYKLLNPIEVWISFWSNQIFKAACFIKLVNSNNYESAKKSINGLPFSFINKNWKLYNYEKLLNAHSRLYEIDGLNRLNVTNLISLELWYNDFMLK